MRARPPQYDVILEQNGAVYASYTEINGTWMRGLFAQKDLEAGELLCHYQGLKLTSDEAERSLSQYLMVARDPGDLRRRIVLDGNPDLVCNICGYSNYASNDVANTAFTDETERGGEVRIALRASRNVTAGTELRVDYDMGCRKKRPFRSMLLASGELSGCESGEYLTVQWEVPTA